MANNIYIGMRYVPLFDGTYNSEKVYEPLTVVEYNNSSYTSKRQVPAGILPTNTEYWARSGDFNAQYNELSQRIEAVADTADSAVTTAESAVTAAGEARTAAAEAERAAENALAVANKQYRRNRNVILIGDSYGDDLNEWPALITSIVPFSHVYNLSVGAHGFTGKAGAPSGPSGESLRWITDLRTWATNNPDLVSTIDDIYVVGGFNDIYSTYDVIKQYMEEFFSYVASTFGCRCHLGVCGWCGSAINTTTPNLTDASGEFRFRISDIVCRAYSECGEYGASFIGNLSLCLHNYATDFDSSNYHPSAVGSKKIATALASYMMGGSVHCYIPETAEVFSDGNNNVTLFWASMRDEVVGIVQTMSNALDFDLTSAMVVGQAYETHYTYVSGIVLGKSRGYGNHMIPCRISDQGGVHEGVCEINPNNKLIIIPYAAIPSGTRVRVRINTGTLNAAYC